MEIHLPSFQERRQFGRVIIPEPAISQVYVPQSQKLWENQGSIRNISLGGIYFLCDEEPPFGKDAIRHLILDAVHNNQKIYRLQFHGVIVRIEDPLRDSFQVAIALKFLSDPLYYPLTATNYAELPVLDKVRLMYQYYRLNLKAHEIIKGAPDIRPERIEQIKQRIKQNVYGLKSEEFARQVTSNLLEENQVSRKK
jgi:hypothetical protein